jgi:hypothetical protein
MKDLQSKFDTLFNNYKRACESVNWKPIDKPVLNELDYRVTIELVLQKTNEAVAEYTKMQAYRKSCNKLLDDAISKQQIVMSNLNGGF